MLLQPFGSGHGTKKPSLKQRVAQSASSSHGAATGSSNHGAVVEAASSSHEGPGHEAPAPPNTYPAPAPWLQLRRRLGIGAGTDCHGPMHDLLREKWARGKLSSTDIHILAAASGEDNDRRLHKVRKIGATRDSKTRVNLFKNSPLYRSILLSTQTRSILLTTQTCCTEASFSRLWLLVNNNSTGFVDLNWRQ